MVSFVLNEWCAAKCTVGCCSELCPFVFIAVGGSRVLHGGSRGQVRWCQKMRVLHFAGRIIFLFLHVKFFFEEEGWDPVPLTLPLTSQTFASEVQTPTKTDISALLPDLSVTHWPMIISFLLFTPGQIYLSALVCPVPSGTKLTNWWHQFPSMT